MLNKKREKLVIDTHNKCIKTITESKLTTKETVITLAQLLIFIGSSISEKTLNVYEMNIERLWREYYSENENNDIGLGLVLNGAQLMSAIEK